MDIEGGLPYGPAPPLGALPLADGGLNFIRRIRVQRPSTDFIKLVVIVVNSIPLMIDAIPKFIATATKISITGINWLKEKSSEYFAPPTEQQLPLPAPPLNVPNEGSDAPEEFSLSPEKQELQQELQEWIMKERARDFYSSTYARELILGKKQDDKETWQLYYDSILQSLRRTESEKIWPRPTSDQQQDHEGADGATGEHDKEKPDLGFLEVFSLSDYIEAFSLFHVDIVKTIQVEKKLPELNEIKKLYKKEQLTFHPDKSKGVKSQDQSIKINMAFSKIKKLYESRYLQKQLIQSVNYELELAYVLLFFVGALLAIVFKYEMGTK